MIAGITFACIFGGALLGMAFLLPSPIRHLHDVPELPEEVAG